jgi:hypothetical protein
VFKTAEETEYFYKLAGFQKEALSQELKARAQERSATLLQQHESSIRKRRLSGEEINLKDPELRAWSRRNTQNMRFEGADVKHLKRDASARDTRAFEQSRGYTKTLPEGAPSRPPADPHLVKAQQALHSAEQLQGRPVHTPAALPQSSPRIAPRRPTTQPLHGAQTSPAHRFPFMASSGTPAAVPPIAAPPPAVGAPPHIVQKSSATPHIALPGGSSAPSVRPSLGEQSKALAARAPKPYSHVAAEAAPNLGRLGKAGLAVGGLALGAYGVHKYRQNQQGQ